MSVLAVTLATLAPAPAPPMAPSTTFSFAPLGNGAPARIMLVSAGTEPNDTLDTARPVTFNTPLTLQLTPEGDRDVLTVEAPGDGAVLLDWLERGGHDGPFAEWLRADGTAAAPPGERTARVSAGDRLYVRIRSAEHAWNEKARDQDIRFQVRFSPEPYDEPNDTLETATPANFDEALTFRLMPRYDRDTFAVTAPENGAFWVDWQETGGHEGAYVEWRHLDGSAAAGAGEPSTRVMAGETLTLQVRSAEHYWNEQARGEPLGLIIRFSPETDPEPNDTADQATPLALEETVTFRLMPRYDRDAFAVTAPEDGALWVEWLDTGGHGDAYVEWHRADGSAAAGAGERSTRVAAGETLALQVRSAEHYWNEQAREDPLSLIIRFSPETDPEPNDTADQATPVALEETVTFRLMPRYDRDALAVTAPKDGAVWVEWLDTGGHDGAFVEWHRLDGSAAAGLGERSTRIAAGETLALQVRSAEHTWNEQSREDLLSLAIRFSPETDPEPNETAAEATWAAIDAPITFRLMPRYDRDTFAVTAPEDGAFWIDWQETGGHDGAYVEWHRQDGSAAADRGVRSVRAAAGETLAVQVRSAEHAWNEQGRIEPMRLTLRFSEEPYAEPNDTVAEATPVAVSEAITLRIMPRYDRDTYAIDAPTDGTLVVEVLDNGGHEGLHLSWLNEAGEPVATGGSLDVSAGDHPVLQVRSAEHAWNEQARVDPVSLRLRLRRPDGTWLDEVAFGDTVILRPWQVLTLAAGTGAPMLRIAAPQAGIYALDLDGDRAVTPAWSGGYPVALANARALDKGEEATITLPLEAGVSNAEPLRVTVRLLARDARDPPGLYPRLPPVLALPELTGAESDR